MANYIELLKHPSWQKKRLEIFQRDKFECSDCGSKTKSLHVHHLWYEKDKNPWEYPDECYQTLCYGCHDKVSTKKKEFNKVLRCFLSAGGDYDLLWGYIAGRIATDGYGFLPKYDGLNYAKCEGLIDAGWANCEVKAKSVEKFISEIKSSK